MEVGIGPKRPIWGMGIATNMEWGGGEKAVQLYVMFDKTSNQTSTNLRTEAEPQQIVAQRLLSCLPYLVPNKSSTEDFTQPAFCFAVK